MSLALLHDTLIAELGTKLAGWQFVKLHRLFRQTKPDCVWSFHLAFINHKSDFDVVADVAVEHILKRKHICIVGAELGNIRGIGQHRWKVSSIQQIPGVAGNIYDVFVATGLPFMQRYSNLSEVLHVLRTDPIKARLICPLIHDPQAEAARIEERVTASSL